MSFGYDADGNRAWMSDGAGTETYEYDLLDRLTAVSRGDDVFGYAYDVAGDLLSRTYPDETVTTYAYDDDGRLASATVGETTTTYTYDAAGNPLTATTPDDITARYAYDRAGRLLEVANTSASGTLSRSSYALDPAGNRLTLSSTRGTTYYTYDALDRLLDACFDGSCAGSRTPVACLGCVGSLLETPAATISPDPADVEVSWTYDTVGNRLTQSDFAGTTAYAYDTLDRLTAVTAPDESVTAYTYDANGNELSAGSDTFAYDLADRMTTASAGGASESYTWSGDGIRLSASDGTDSIAFLTDRGFGLPQTALERDGTGTTLRRYTYSLGQIAEQSPTDGTVYLHQDGLGSVTDLTDPSGTPLAWSDYAPFGAVRSAGVASGAPASPFGFTGQYADSTGLLHLRARQYNPATGRFLSTDPIAVPMADPYVAAYVYVGQNPVLFSDPSGKCVGPLVIVCAVAVGAAVGVGSYIVSTVAANVVENVAESRDPLDDVGRGLNPLDAAISGAAGVLGGPIGAIAFGPTRVLAGAALGCAATFASQAAGGRSGDLIETAIGCAAGGAGSIYQVASNVGSFIYGSVVALSQAVATYFEQSGAVPEGTGRGRK